MKKLKEKTLTRSLAKGMLAGLIGGLVATAAKTLTEKIYRRRTHGELDPLAILAEKLVGHELVGTQKTAAVETLHWGFGALTGAAYGALAEYYPQATAKEGAAFGMALTSLTHGTGLPALGLPDDAHEQTTRERTSEMATHVVYGVVTETVRRRARKMLG